MLAGRATSPAATPQGVRSSVPGTTAIEARRSATPHGRPSDLGARCWVQSPRDHVLQELGGLLGGLTPHVSETQRAAPGSKSKKARRNRAHVALCGKRERKKKAKAKERDIRASFKRSRSLEVSRRAAGFQGSRKHRAVTFLGAFISDTQTGASTRPPRKGKRLIHSSSDAREQDTALYRVLSRFVSQIPGSGLGSHARTQAPANPQTRRVPG